METRGANGIGDATGRQELYWMLSNLFEAKIMRVYYLWLIIYVGVIGAM